MPKSVVITFNSQRFIKSITSCLASFLKQSKIRNIRTIIQQFPKTVLLHIPSTKYHILSYCRSKFSIAQKITSECILRSFYVNQTQVQCECFLGQSKQLLP
ncbi:hypothetical protein I3843_03G019500 [Carya illinoinensis]|uniref:Uncharacterized protein n=1 Tax=Carya illinoinensis TaxID=32201 RepID=A0A8T1QXZ3_CARIL|nr:hypothetical protein I3760_03G016400 [Carya illinoinensis]KAG6659285.1 hypothetical protein CIPAW_03G023100 [Carya illinoinensis]KAG7985315.1 hypothetical protein I3843_03G019500 [Carya illinoinensis]